MLSWKLSSYDIRSTSLWYQRYHLFYKLVVVFKISLILDNFLFQFEAFWNNISFICSSNIVTNSKFGFSFTRSNSYLTFRMMRSIPRPHFLSYYERYCYRLWQHHLRDSPNYHHLLLSITYDIITTKLFSVEGIKFWHNLNIDSKNTYMTMMFYRLDKRNIQNIILQLYGKQLF